jgi:demethylmenaquinone methyltransferase/2-methoxy-6-polyprenyl-1,4-benzoquinol methylase
MTRELDRSFGYQTVSAAERRKRIRSVFARVAERYDLMNDLMSFRLHRWWKRRFVKSILDSGAQVVVDLAGGTGDVAIALSRSGRRAIVCDPSQEMMAVGRRRGTDRVEWVAGEAEALPFATSSVDCVSIALGIRNVTSLERALHEIARVLKPGGSFRCLEFSTPQPWARAPYNFFSFAVIPRLGAAVAQAPEAYTYLVESIRNFPNQEQFKGAIEAAGFREVTYRDLTFGVVSIHSGRKPGEGTGVR